jgi:hypothetical protein
MSVAHKHDCNVVSLQTTPSIVLGGRDAAESEDLLVPTSRAGHVIGLKHRNQCGHAHATLHKYTI